MHYLEVTIKRQTNLPWQVRRVAAAVVLTAILCFAGPWATAQTPDAALDTGTTVSAVATPVGEGEEGPSAPATVAVRPESADMEIEARIQRILTASEWFRDPKVKVDEGIVFLSGQTETDTLKKWAGDMARSTRDVVAVVNRIEVDQPPIWDMGPAIASLMSMWRGFIKSLPLMVVGFAVLVISWYIARFTAWALMRNFNRREFLTPLLREVISRTVAGLVFLLGLYMVLLILGLARLAVTVLGGTGLIGLVLGIAFRDITENFLASIFLSIQRPFRSGDMIEVAGITGLVQRLTVRTTVLITMEGNHVQIPNSTIYKSTIRNFTSNPNTRDDFTIGISHQDSTPEAQEIALRVLQEHPAVLDDPEPWVLVDSLGPSAVYLKVYFWMDTSKHSGIKVRSSIIRLIKRAFQEHGITIPDEAREVIISQEVPINVRISPMTGQSRTLQNVIVEQLEEPEAPQAEEPAEAKPETIETKAVSTTAEGGLKSEVSTVEQQAEGARIPEEGADLLEPKKPSPEDG